MRGGISRSLGRVEQLLRRGVGVEIQLSDAGRECVQKPFGAVFLFTESVLDGLQAHQEHSHAQAE